MVKDLMKDEVINLTTEYKSVRKLKLCFSWYVKSERIKLFHRNERAFIDCDVSAILLRNSEFKSEEDIVGVHNLIHRSGAVVHNGENVLVPGDEEFITVDLDELPEDVNRLLFVINAESPEGKSYDLSMLDEIRMQVIDDTTGNGMFKIDTAGCEGCPTLITLELFKSKGEWKLEALLAATEDKTVYDLATMMN